MLRAKETPKDDTILSLAWLTHSASPPKDYGLWIWRDCVFLFYVLYVGLYPYALGVHGASLMNRVTCALTGWIVNDYIFSVLSRLIMSVLYDGKGEHIEVVIIIFKEAITVIKDDRVYTLKLPRKDNECVTPVCEWWNQQLLSIDLSPLKFFLLHKISHHIIKILRWNICISSIGNICISSICNKNSLSM